MKNATTTLVVLFFLIGYTINNAAFSQADNTTELELTQIDSKEYKFLHFKGFEAKIEMELSVEGLKELKMESGAGKVIIEPSNSGKIEVNAHVIISAKNQRKAEFIAKEHLQLSLGRHGNMAMLMSIFDFEKRKNVKEQVVNPEGFFTSPVRKVDLVVKVPSDLFLSVTDHSGDLFLQKLNNDAKVNDYSGYLELNEVNGDLSIYDSSGDLKLVNVNKGYIQNRVKIDDNSGLVTLHGVGGNIFLNDASGDIEVKNIHGSLEIDDTSGAIWISKVVGDFKVDDTSGEIVSNYIDGNVTIDDTSGDIYFDGVTKNIYISSNGSGQLSVKNLEGRISGDLKRLNRL
ncbi:DUF4097 family beta strand repeat-containing protein [Fulvivirgaceae bacterium BMA10]|uniref:DUF4097 family beta strand repeat-containing protein n=1 Tax=Splendidivirga corallicola TaxID=3051826 RepID=A0ABT8KQ33_9BACT|nr:DUF4097 family beta strand repeat-containing protein [Fulvivirgaceae bacterium BMA10]